MRLKHAAAKWAIAGMFGLVAVVGAVGLGWQLKRLDGNSANRTVMGLEALLTCSAEAIQGEDIAHLNLLCAQALPGAASLDMEASLAMLREMAARVRVETERHRYRFKANPAAFENSEGFFRMIMLGVVLNENWITSMTAPAIRRGIPGPKLPTGLPQSHNQSKCNLCNSRNDAQCPWCASVA